MNKNMIVKIVATIVVSLSVGYYAGSGVASTKTQTNQGVISTMSVEIEKRDDRIAVLEREVSQLKERLVSNKKPAADMGAAFREMQNVKNKSKGHTFRMP